MWNNFIMKKTAYLIRTEYPDYTAGILTLTDEDRVLFTCNTMELPNKQNKQYVSCIPYGRYAVVPYSSTKFPNVYQVLDVPNRDKILIHIANTVADLLGCIGVGMYFKKGVISSSKTTLSKLKAITSSFDLVIIDGKNAERGIESFIPTIVSLLGTLTPQIIELITAKKDVKKVIK